MMDVLAALLAAAGMTALSLAMSRHHRDLFGSGTPARRRLALRLLGSALLSLCIFINVERHGTGIGLVIAMTEIMTAGVLVGLALGWATARRRSVSNAAS